MTQLRTESIPETPAVRPFSSPAFDESPVACSTAPPQVRSVPFGERGREACRAATEINQKEPDWVTFFREVLGVGGIVQQLYPTPEALAEFVKTPEYADIQRMLTRLRAKCKTGSIDNPEPTRVITVRMPKSLHESLRSEAHMWHTSMNQLCISKLVQLIDSELVPTE